MHTSIPVQKIAYKRVSDYASLTAAVAAIGATVTTLIIDTATTITAATVIPANITIIVLRTGSITKVAGTLTINGAFSAGSYKVFYSFATDDVSFSVGSVDHALTEWWGAVGDDATDCTVAVQCAFDSYPEVHFLKGTYKLNYSTASAIYMNKPLRYYRITGKGLSTIIKGYNYPAGKHIFKLNEDSLGNVVNSGPGAYKAFFEMMGFDLSDASNNATASVMKVNTAPVYWRTVYLNSVYYGIETVNYCDGIGLYNVTASGTVKAGGAIYYQGSNGDNLVIKQCYSMGNYYTAFVNRSSGGVIEQCMGKVRLYNTHGSSIRNHHQEGLTNGHMIEINNSTVTIEDSYLMNQYIAPGTYYPVYINDELGTNLSASQVTLRNNLFPLKNTNGLNYRAADIYIKDPSPTTTIFLINNFSVMYQQNYFTMNGKMGITAQSSDATLSALLQTNKSLLSGDIAIGYFNGAYRVFPISGRVDFMAYSAAASMNVPTESGVYVGTIPAGTTYYYRCAIVNLMGSSAKSTERSKLTTANNVSIQIQVNGSLPSSIIRIWRGTAPDTYDRYVDIPTPGGYVVYLHDTGGAVSGYEWIIAGIPTPPTVNTLYEGTMFLGGKREFNATAAPTAGTWAVGDRAINSAPAVGQPKAWSYTGTWTSEGNL